MPPRELQVVVVSTTDGLEIRGLLREWEEGRFMVLTSAAIAGEQNGQTVWRELIGEVVIPEHRVSYYQRGLPPDILAQIGAKGAS